VENDKKDTGYAGDKRGRRFFAVVPDVDQVIA
jgi:hypothetical protein